jgi:rod shape-determining protein MreB and related proteins
MQRGVYLAGGGALIRGLPELLSDALGVKVKVAPEPLTAVVRGAGIVLDNMSSYEEALLASEDELVPTE